VECDGDRYRSPESLAEGTARQAVLERLGWPFVRIRGSAFYRDPDTALRRVFDRLAELGIKPLGVANADRDEDVALERTLIEELEEIRDRGPAPLALSAPAPIVAAPGAKPARKPPRRYSRSTR
jgi:hypothetical protein